MRSHYKKLGPYIQEVNQKNTDLSVTRLLGVSVSKEFIPSIANIIGTNIATYKIVRRHQFAYGPVTSRNSDKVSVALLNEDECIVSTSYTTFEIIDHELLLPEYLMMWFRRPEFDRYARFMSHGSVRELFGWEEMCDVELPIPSIEQQRKIVKEYHTIVNRINLNEWLNQKLEETAQAIYKQWFVDFEFPISAEYAASIAKSELEGQPYKSSGCEMVYNEVLKLEVPRGWKNIPLYKTASYVNGAAFRESDFFPREDGLPVIKIAELKDGVTENTNFSTLKGKEKVYIEDKTLLYSWSGNPGTSLEVFKWFGGPAVLNQHIFKLGFGKKQREEFVYYLLKFLKPVFIKLAEGKQTTGLGHVTVADMKRLNIPYPNEPCLLSFVRIISPFYEYDSLLIQERATLNNLLQLLLGRIAQVKEL